MQIKTSWRPYRFSIIINLSLTHLYCFFFICSVLPDLTLLLSPVLFTHLYCFPQSHVIPEHRPLSLLVMVVQELDSLPLVVPQILVQRGRYLWINVHGLNFCSELLCKPSLWQILILGVITGIFVHVRNIRTCKYHVLVMVNTTLSIP